MKMTEYGAVFDIEVVRVFARNKLARGPTRRIDGRLDFRKLAPRLGQRRDNRRRVALPIGADPLDGVEIHVKALGDRRVRGRFNDGRVWSPLRRTAWAIIAEITPALSPK